MKASDFRSRKVLELRIPCFMVTYEHGCEICATFKYNTLIVDLDKGKPIATFKGRRAEEVVTWFSSRPQDERDRVDVVVLDMSKSFFAAIKEVFGDQVHVIDRFHVVQQAVEALDSVLLSGCQR